VARAIIYMEQCMTNYRILAAAVILAGAGLLQGCYTAPTPVTVPGRTMGERFEKSWQAARGAAADAGVRVTSEDRGTGTLKGSVGASNVLITVVPQQVDQTIQVGFSVTGGDASQDANLKEHLTHAYQRRMGR
jgi:hypothetical protein